MKTIAPITAPTMIKVSSLEDSELCGLLPETIVVVVVGFVVGSGVAIGSGKEYVNPF